TQNLRAYDIPVAMVARAEKENNQPNGASVIEQAEAEYMVTATGYIQSTAALPQTPLGIQNNGVALLIRDVCRVTLGPQMRRGIAEGHGNG
ncbi:hypothetical protein, partial [Pseudoalteromonas ruthenica]|uniref:hypothetical protein n=1 Tax=Pseudoalteromonas ruthenica TaxID=151081 RepID=UPI00127BC95E